MDARVEFSGCTVSLTRTPFMLMLRQLKSGDTHCSSERYILTGDKLCELKNSVLGHKYPLGES